MTSHPMPPAQEQKLQEVTAADVDNAVTRALAALAAMIEGDRALGLDAAALVLGVPTRTFQKLASRPGFPRGAKMGKRITWRRRELLDWWEAERDRQNAA